MATEEVDHVRSQAKEQAKHMNLSVVRLCFQAFLMDEHGRFTIPVDPVFSHKVYDSSELTGKRGVVCEGVRLDNMPNMEGFLFVGKGTIMSME